MRGKKTKHFVLSFCCTEIQINLSGLFVDNFKTHKPTKFDKIRLKMQENSRITSIDKINLISYIKIYL